MKIAYVLPIDIVKYNGVLNKVASQIKAWEKSKNKVKVFLITSRELSLLDSTALSSIGPEKVVAYKSKKLGLLPIDLFKDWLGFRGVFCEVHKDIEKFSPDIVYARSALYQPFYGKLGSRHKLVLELNTDMASEYKLQSKQSIKYFFRYIYYLATAEKLFKGVSGMAAVTFDIAKVSKVEGKEVEVFPNSIDVYQYPDYMNKDIGRNIVFIGSPDMPWQGFDILIKLAKRLPTIKFNVIGVSKISGLASSNVVFHGFMKKEEYLNLLDSASACIGTLALFRKNMEEACPLKVREYVACCKPVILPYKDTAFESLGYPDWVLQLPNNEKGILSASDKVEEFVDKCKDFNINKEDVKKYVHVDDIEGRRLLFFEKVMNSTIY